MRIGMMLRPLDERGGIGTYTRYLLDELLAIDTRNHYVLFYRTPEHVGRYGGRDNVTEVVVRGRHKAWWDQVAVPLACARHRVDLVFHPKFTVPFLAPCPAMMVVHGADWLIPEQARFYPRLNVLYERTFLPWYIRRSCAVISVARLTTEDFERVLALPPLKMRTVYFGPARHFRRVEDPAALAAVRERYGLPDRFVLTLSGGDRARRKNIGGILEAFRLLNGSVPHRLVIGGRGLETLREDHGIPADGWGAEVRFPGWIAQEDLPAVYSAADLFLYPSNLEAFPIPLTEAMACGTPIVTSDVNGLVEIAGDAARFVDPTRPDDIAAAAREVLTRPEVAAELSRRGRERSRIFSWERCARETLAIIEEFGPAADGHAHPSAP